MGWWVLTYLENNRALDSLHVFAETNHPAHLIMAWSTFKPARRPIYRIVRGARIFCGWKYVWDTPNLTEQMQPLDTFEHLFKIDSLDSSDHIWYLLSSTRKLYEHYCQSALIHVPPPATLAWAPRMLVATKTKGIYYSRGFTGPQGDHPTWTRHNAGLLSLNIEQLHGDPWIPGTRQYVLIRVNGTRLLYRRNVPAEDYWRFILSDAQAATLTGSPGGRMRWLTTNWNRPGYLYVMFQSTIHTNGVWCLRSPDFGATWTAHNMHMPAGTPEAGNIVCGLAQGSSEYPAGDVIYACRQGSAIVVSSMYVSYDNGTNWAFRDNIPSWSVRPRCHVDPANQKTVYFGTENNIGLLWKLWRSEDYGAALASLTTTERLAICLNPSHAQMWIHPTNNAFLKILRGDHMWQSWNYCATWEDLGPMMVPAQRLSIVDANPGSLYLARDTSAPLPPDLGWPHVLFTSDDHGATMIGKCGPHAQQSNGGGDSIPHDCGGLAHDGILPLP